MQEQRKAKPQELVSLFPLCHMTREELILFCELVNIKAAKRGKVLLEQGQSDKKSLFLLHGLVQLEDEQGNELLVDATSPKSHKPISFTDPHPYRVVAKSQVEYLRVDNNVINNLLDKKPIVEQLSQDSENPLLNRIKFDLEKDRLEIPSNPNITQQIAQKFDDNIDISSLEKLLSSDPALASSVVKAANSALFRKSNGQITSVQRAIIRIGLNTVRFLVNSFMVRRLFVSQSSKYKKAMQERWMHCIDVAAASYVLAEIAEAQGLDFDPDTAMLVGLLHDIGDIAIIAYADKFPDLCPSAENIEDVSKNLKAEIGALVLQQWQFDEQFSITATHIDNWQREHEGPADYCDLATVAQYHVYLMEKTDIQLPELLSLPSFNKLGLNAKSANNGIEIVHMAQQQFAQIRSLFV